MICGCEDALLCRLTSEFQLQRAQIRRSPCRSVVLQATDWSREGGLKGFQLVLDALWARRRARRTGKRSVRLFPHHSDLLRCGNRPGITTKCQSTCSQVNTKHKCSEGARNSCSQLHLMHFGRAVPDPSLCPLVQYEQ